MPAVRPGSRPWSERLAGAAIRFRYAVAVAAVGLTVASAFPALDLVRLRVRTNLFALLPGDHPSVRTLRAVIDKSGGWGDVMVVIESGEPEANRLFAGRLQASLAGTPWINYSEFRADTAFLERHALLLLAPSDLETIERRLRDRVDYEVAHRDPGYVDLLDEGPPDVDVSDIEARYRQGGLLRPYHESPDGRTLVLAIYPAGLSGEVRTSRAYLDTVRAKIAAVDRAGIPPDLRVRLAGTFTERLEDYDAVIADLERTAAIMAALFLLLVLVHFRQAGAVPLVFLTFTLPLVWTFAVARFVVAELNVITVFLVNVLSGLGIDFAFHTLTRYLEERTGGRSLGEALAVVNGSTARACRAAAATTAVAFFVLMATRFLGFRQFGIIAGFGLSFAFLSGYLVLPSFIAIAEDLRILRHRPAASVRFPLPVRRAGTVLVAGALLAGAGVVAATRLEIERDFSRLRTRVPPATRQLRDTVHAVFGVNREPVVVLAGTLEETAEIESALARRQRERGAASHIDAVISVLDVIPPDQEVRLAAIARIGSLLDGIEPFASPEDQARIARLRPLLATGPVMLADLPENLRWRFFGVPGSPGNLVYVLHHVPLVDTRLTAELVEEIRTIDGRTRRWSSSSEAVIVDDLLRVMKEDSARAIALSSLAVFVVLVAGLRSPRRAAITMLPLAIGVFWMLGVMWIAGLKPNFYNMVVFPSILGIGVDSGVHIYHRFLESPDRSVHRALGATLGAVSMSALTTMVSFGSMIASAHQGLASLGLLAFIGLGTTLVAATVMFPLFLERFRSRCR